MHATKLDQGLAALKQQLAHIGNQHQAARLALSLGAEDMLLVHLLASARLPIQAFVLDTGRLHPQSYAFLARVRERYELAVNLIFPHPQDVEKFYTSYGPNGFYDSIEARKACCNARKVVPLKRALQGADAWITGQRRAQSITRTKLAIESFDQQHQIMKYNPLAEWSSQALWDAIHKLKVMTHPLHAQGMPSIGCQPCTRAVAPGENERAGRWWWENPTSRECGIHRP